MTMQNVLVVVLGDGLERPLGRAMAHRSDEPRHVHVIAPIRLGALDWLASADDEAREDADRRALRAEWTVADHADVEWADLEGEAGEPDPVLAVEDALRVFPADEILLVAGADESASIERSLQRFGLPVTRVPASGRGPRPGRARELAHEIAAGRSQATPFVLLIATGLVLVGLSALIALIVTLLHALL